MTRQMAAFSLMRVGDDELGATQSPADQAFQERRPKRLGFRWPDMQAHNLPLALGIGCPVSTKPAAVQL